MFIESQSIQLNITESHKTNVTDTTEWLFLLIVHKPLSSSLQCSINSSTPSPTIQWLTVLHYNVNVLVFNPPSHKAVSACTVCGCMK